ncbi:cell division protein FtsZ [Halovulum dunhuangense]|uniref:Cell division protein FtsZ n=1 Tax=Halovulum dunhuangense TaxID=1505036 RepID=A0A849L186_9RHOB|nr:cell division protein FtsZ [Halovulum dunhuangense]NNU80017.1 cell division protein FtsZ [Halovulum dunhuangense]
MALTLSMPEQHDLRPRITVFGVGGAGGNAVNNMIEKNLEGAEFVVANTDAQALAQNQAPQKIQLGVEVTQGLGAGARPEIGSAAAEESIEAIVDQLSGAHMCFITAGMGGGTGTGAAPIIARAAREMGVLTVGVVTKPFQFEGARRMRQAEAGVEELQKVVDTLIVIPNQNLFRLANEKTTFTEAFSMADDVLYQGVKGVTDLMVRPGIINLDFADIRSVMDEMGKAMMGTGEAEGEDRAIQAAEKAIANPLLDEISLKGAKGVLINVTGGPDLTLFELDEAANRIRSEVDPDANIIVGSTLDPEMSGKMRVSVVATGIDAEQGTSAAPATGAGVRRPAAQPAAPAPQPRHEPVAVQRAEEDIPAGRSFVDARAQRQPEPAPAPAAAHREIEAPVTHQMIEDEAPEPQQQMRAVEQPMAEAPRRAGEPSAETLQRLAAAVNRKPETQAERPASAPLQRPRAAEPEGGRFAINSLIHRMTGQGHREERETAPRQSPPLTSGNGERRERDPSEIPAFLRRQAN